MRKLWLQKGLAFLLTLALCFTFFPASAYAEEGQPDGEQITGETVGTDATDTDGAADASGAVQALNDALPTAEEVRAMPEAEQEAVYGQAQEAHEAYLALTEDEQAQTDAAKIEALLQYFSEQAAPTADDRAAQPDEGATAGPFLVEGGLDGTDYDWDNTAKKLTIKTDKQLTISTPNNSADNSATAHIHAPQVSGQDTNAKLTLNGVHITEPQNTGYGAICVTSTLDITLADGTTNTLTGGAVTSTDSSAYNSSGIYSGGALTINGSGTLNATGGAVTTSSSDNDNRSAGIVAGSSITINGGTIHATGGSVNNGRSNGLYINGGSITINGGSGTAQANTSSTHHKAMYPNPTYTSGYVTGQEADTFRKWLPKATEQYSALTPGETYWFDLSGQKTDMGGTVNGNLPDAAMHWVPFTYAGTVNAYKLDSEQATTEEYAGMNQSEHSLFIANYDLTQASWNDLNAADLIFGKTYENNGVSYTLRAPSAGSKTVTVGSSGSQTEYVTPLTNEWDSILMKDDADNAHDVYIKNATETNRYSWGQDTSAIANDSAKRIARKGGSYTSNTLPADGTEQSGSNGWYRPVLKLTGNASALKVVEVNLNAGTLGDGTNSTPKIVTTSTGEFRAPDVSCITPTDGHVFCGWTIDNSASNKRYDAGDLIDNTAQVTKLNANWETVPYIAQHPADLTVTSGTEASFTVKAIGEVTYQWQSSTDGTNWTDVSGANTDTLTISSTNTDMNGTKYRCAVTLSGATTTSNAAKLTVNPKIHNFSEEWKSNETQHWHECECGEKSAVDAHTFEWEIDKEAGVGVPGSKHEECKICHYKKAAVEIPAKP